MYRSKILLVLATCMFTLCASAQDEKLNTIYLLQWGDFTTNMEVRQANAADVAAAAVSALVLKSNETEEQHPDVVPRVVETIKSALPHAYRLVDDGEHDYEVTISGNVNDITTQTTVKKVERKQKDGTKKKVTETSYRAIIDVTLKSVDTQTNKERTKTLRVDELSEGRYASESDAINYALKALRYKVLRYFNSGYAIKARVLEQSNVKNDKVKTVKINVGTNDGVHEDMNFLVNEVQMENGRIKNSRQIGRVRVNENPGMTVSECRVKEGAREIKAMLDEGGHDIMLWSTERTY